MKNQLTEPCNEKEDKDIVDECCDNNGLDIGDTNIFTTDRKKMQGPHPSDVCGAMGKLLCDESSKDDTISSKLVCSHESSLILKLDSIITDKVETAINKNNTVLLHSIQELLNRERRIIRSESVDLQDPNILQKTNGSI